ncbi:DEAD-box ATP-dependent RNA helicase 42 [Datura stramonium]|uniref:DEAD-box ATP-dependent RNA helicase 42 n=1 Tax=Datura stramonium TaxID=4076 RepID=A0ABS8V589_DATST|nr:DEAD-box ATP-dependent RNA helicase 42 [Datura stramonium]
MPEHYEAELEINDFPQNARWKVTLAKETLSPISSLNGQDTSPLETVCSTPASTRVWERKPYLFIEGPTEQSVKRAKAELKRVLEDITMQAFTSWRLHRVALEETWHSVTLTNILLGKKPVRNHRHKADDYAHYGAVPVYLMDQ